MQNKPNINFEDLYLDILSLLPIRRLSDYELWRVKAGSFEKIFYATETELEELGLGLEIILKLRKLKSQWSIEKLAHSLEKTFVQTLPYTDATYPNILKEIFDAPPVLFFRGELKPTENCIAVVGSRKMSDYGAVIVPKITTPLIEAGLTIVSGLAYGIDSAAHAQSLKRGARTIAVLGSGIDQASIYPHGHFRLSEEILENNGLLLSEQPPGTPGLKHHFIARNRIIAGLSLGVVVVEAKRKSGALLTADFAMDFNRAVYAVPGPIYSSLSDGPHGLIKSGAGLVSSGQEILDDLEITTPSLSEQTLAFKTQSFSEAEQLVLECMQGKILKLSELAELTTLTAPQLLLTLTTLELKGEVQNLGGEKFTSSKL